MADLVLIKLPFILFQVTSNSRDHYFPIRAFYISDDSIILAEIENLYMTDRLR